MPREYASLINDVVGIVERAGSEVMAVYGTKFDVESKADHSPLTLADTRSHRALRDALAKLTPDIPLLSEESDPLEYEARRKWTRYWLVDPLDGTKEFVSRNGEFTVNVALIDEHRPVLGVVGAPARGEVFVGFVPDHHAEKRVGGKAFPLRARRMGTAPLSVVASRSHGGERLERFIGALASRFGHVDRVPMGSSLKLCMLADGRADLYPRLGPTSEWDIAAAQAVLESAGGAVWTFDRSTLAYNTKDSLLNPEFLAVADPTYAWWEALPSV